MMQAYAEYKDSGVDWLGEIPAGWEKQQVKRLFAIGRGRVISKEELDENGSFPVYSSQTKNSGILGYINTCDFDAAQITWTTDGVNAGTVFLRSGKYNCTNVCGTLKPKTDRTNLPFCAYTIGMAALFYKRPDTNGAKIMNDENGSFPVYSSQTKNSGILGYINTCDFDAAQITWTTDGVNAGTVFLRSGKYNCTNVCGTLKPKTDRTNLPFCTYTIGVAALFYKRTDTNGAKIMNEEMAVIEFPLPLLAEQTAIADFIDDESEKINAAIKIKENQIAKLNEYKTTLINAAVTGKIKVT